MSRLPTSKPSTATGLRDMGTCAAPVEPGQGARAGLGLCGPRCRRSSQSPLKPVTVTVGCVLPLGPQAICLPHWPGLVACGAQWPLDHKRWVCPPLSLSCLPATPLYYPCLGLNWCGLVSG